MRWSLQSKPNFFYGLFGQPGHAEESGENCRSCHEAGRDVGELVLSCSQDEDSVRSLSQLDGVDPRQLVPVADVVDVETGKDLVQEVDRSDGTDFPTKSAQDEKLTFLFFG